MNQLQECCPVPGFLLAHDLAVSTIPIRWIFPGSLSGWNGQPSWKRPSSMIGPPASRRAGMNDGGFTSRSRTSRLSAALKLPFSQSGIPALALLPRLYPAEQPGESLNCQPVAGHDSGQYFLDATRPAQPHNRRVPALTARCTLAQYAIWRLLRGILWGIWGATLKGTSCEAFGFSPRGGPVRAVGRQPKPSTEPSASRYHKSV